MASRRSPKLRVLDVGCGGGILADSMARKGFSSDVLGSIDLADKALKVAQLHAPGSGDPRREVPQVSVAGARAAEAAGKLLTS